MAETPIRCIAAMPPPMIAPPAPRPWGLSLLAAVKKPQLRIATAAHNDSAAALKA